MRQCSMLQSPPTRRAQVSWDPGPARRHRPYLFQKRQLARRLELVEKDAIVGACVVQRSFGGAQRVQALRRDARARKTGRQVDVSYRSAVGGSGPTASRSNLDTRAATQGLLGQPAKAHHLGLVGLRALLHLRTPFLAAIRVVCVDTLALATTDQTCVRAHARNNDAWRAPSWLEGRSGRIAGKAS